MIDAWDSAESRYGLAADALRGRVNEALERGLSGRETVELLALSVRLKRLLDDFDRVPEYDHVG